MRRIVAFAACFLLVLIPSALAADPDEVADQVDPRGYYLEPGVDVDFQAMEDLVDEVADDADTRFYFVALAADPPGGADEFAEDVLTRLPQGSTVVVVSPGEIGARSDTFRDADLDRAAEAAISDADGSYEADFRVFALSLVDAGDTAGNGGRGTLIFLLVVAGVVALVFYVTRRAAKRDREQAGRRLDEARAEITEQLDVIANEILDLADRVTLSERDEAEEYFRVASASYQEAQGALDGASSLAELERLSDQLDRTRWQLAAAEAVVEGRPVPPEPEDRPNSCFFDPTHRAGTEEAEIKTRAGTRTVSVCPDCADQLRRGEQPRPREISVGGRRIPAPMAPRSYGGGGFDWMGAFAVILSGLARGASYNYGRRPRRVGGLGGPMFPGLSRRTGGGRRMGGSVSRRAGPRGVGRTRRKR